MHELDFTTGEAAMAYTGATPWHGLGEALEPGASIDVWAEAAKLNYNLATKPVIVDGIELPGKKIIYREDSMTGMSVVGDSYHLVQPREVLEFFSNWTDGLAQIETAGALFGGRHYWALAKMEGQLDLDGDVTAPYVLLNSSCDGGSATAGRLTSVRVVCNNTLSMATGKKADVSITHRSAFNADGMRMELESMNETIAAHFAQLEFLAGVKMTEKAALRFMGKVLDGVNDAEEMSRKSKLIVENFMSKNFIGSASSATDGTAYGLLQATTEHFDWEHGRKQDNRLINAWMGHTAKVKHDVLDGLLAAA